MKYEVYFDGLCEPTNPGGHGCFGFTINDANGKEMYSGRGYLGKTYECADGRRIPMTNNIAEYSALINAMSEFSKRKLWDSSDTVCLVCKGDSKLVVEQMSGNWKINAPHLRDAVEVIGDVMNGFALEWSMQWIPREQNGRADALSREAYKEVTGHYPPERKKR